MISLYIAHNVIGYFPDAGCKEHKNGTTTELKLCCELPYVGEKKKPKQKSKQSPLPIFIFCCVSVQRELYL